MKDKKRKLGRYFAWILQCWLSSKTARRALATTEEDLQSTVTAFAAASNVSLLATVLAPDVSVDALADVTIAPKIEAEFEVNVVRASKNVATDEEDTGATVWSNSVEDILVLVLVVAETVGFAVASCMFMFPPAEPTYPFSVMKACYIV